MSWHARNQTVTFKSFPLCWMSDRDSETDCVGGSSSSLTTAHPVDGMPTTLPSGSTNTRTLSGR